MPRFHISVRTSNLGGFKWEVWDDKKIVADGWGGSSREARKEANGWISSHKVRSKVLNMTEQELKEADRDTLIQYLEMWGFAVYDRESTEELRIAALKNRRTEDNDES